ncbi:MAG: hypothetical protein EOP48_06840 [Sphingobacteriales bacterium]|nr:MAG: hypothetical protein EOP48_06840 [Sphingobacteriales bacterium]
MISLSKNGDQSNAKNIHFHPADFFKNPWTSDCDAMNFSNVLHDWPEEAVLNFSSRREKPLQIEIQRLP